MLIMRWTLNCHYQWSEILNQSKSDRSGQDDRWVINKILFCFSESANFNIKASVETGCTISKCIKTFAVHKKLLQL